MNKKYSLKFVLALVFSASALTCVILSLLFYWQISSSRDKQDDTRDFAELLEIISNRYIGTFEIDDLSNAAMRAAVDALDDKWSYFMSPQEYSIFLENSDNRYTGIGIEVQINDEVGGIEVLGVYSDSGADVAGLVIGDVITAIDGESIRGLELAEIRLMLRREIGESALLTVFRADGEYHELIVEYNVVFTNPISFEMIADNVGYVSLRNFEFGAAEGFIDAVNTLIEQGAVAFIYDVRSNPGGKVSEMTQILDFLLPEGEIFISISTDGTEQIIRSDANMIDLPAVVLVNSHSYSGAEYFSATLSEYEYAVTIGEQTTGKNRMQTTIAMSGGGAVHISTGEYLTKNRVSLHDTGGYTPDHIIPLSDEKLRQFRSGELDMLTDPHIVKALAILNLQ